MARGFGRFVGRGLSVLVVVSISAAACTEDVGVTEGDAGASNSSSGAPPSGGTTSGGSSSGGTSALGGAGSHGADTPLAGANQIDGGHAGDGASTASGGSSSGGTSALGGAGSPPDDADTPRAGTSPTDGGHAGIGGAGPDGDSHGGAAHGGDGGQAGAERDCAGTTEGPLAPNHCFTHGQCQTGQSCHGTQSAKVCVPVGEGCDASAQCPWDETCTNHRCVTAAAIGSPCSAGNRCAAGARCGYGWEFVDEFTRWVETGALQCRPEIAVTHACATPADDENPSGGCEEGLICSQNRLLDDGEPFEYCFPKGDDNQFFVCLSDNDCLQGYFCEEPQSGEDRHCYRARQAGETCLPGHGDDRCDTNLDCPTFPSNDEVDDSYLCRALPVACEACNGTLGCQNTAFCLNEVCVAKPKLGQPCDPAPCSDGFVCVTAQLDGTCIND